MRDTPGFPARVADVDKSAGARHFPTPMFAAAYWFTFAFRFYFAPENLGGCREN
jgi:hypothetical protein